MAGMIKTMIDTIIEKRSGGDPLIVKTTRARLILKGIDPNRYTLQSNDDATEIEKTRQAARDLGVVL